MRVLSLGWGVQSFTLAAMSALGKLDQLDLAIHSDTRFERQGTYAFASEWTAWLESYNLRVLTVSSGELKRNVTRQLPKGTHEVQIPAFTYSTGGGSGQIRRQCTQEWKVRPFRAEVRRWLPRGVQAEVWLGISADEFQRARTADVRYIRNRFPLLELNMTREDCKTWLRNHDLPVPPKSSCTFCPYHSRPAFAELKRAAGADWEQAVKIDAEIRDKRPPFQLFVHPARIPLAQAVDIPEDHGYVQTGFDPEGRCDEGVCWV
jgi:hypothetical protein